MRPMVIFSWPALVLGSMATRMTGSGNSMDSRMMGAFSSHRVSPVVVFFRPTAASISPEKTSSISSRWLACICRIRPIRSLTFLVLFSTEEPVVRWPE